MSEQPSVATNMVVAIHYTVSEAGGEVIDSSSGGEPLAYLHGHGNFIPGLESALEGAGVGQTFSVTVAPEDAYGLRHSEGGQPVPRENFPADVEITPGMVFYGNDGQGNQHPVWVVGVTDDAVLVDTNHPLAGKTLDFDVEVVSIRAATDEEIENGRANP